MIDKQTETFTLKQTEVVQFLVDGMLEGEQILILRSITCTDPKCAGGPGIHAVLGLSNVSPEDACNLAALYMVSDG